MVETEQRQYQIEISHLPREETISPNPTYWIIAKVGDESIGALWLDISPDKGIIRTIRTNQTYDPQGEMIEALIAQAEQILGRKRIRQATATIDKEDIWTKKAYIKQGWEIVGGPYPDPNSPLTVRKTISTTRHAEGISLPSPTRK